MNVELYVISQSREIKRKEKKKKKKTGISGLI